MKIRAFHGLRFDGTPETAGAAAGPPYDQIDTASRDRYHANEVHFVHLTCPIDRDGVAAHRHSADQHERWLRAGVVGRDGTPTLYGNTIELPSGAVRYGLTALIDVESEESGIIRPHEETVGKTVEERLALLRTTEIDYEPILVLAEDGGVLDELLEEDCRGAADLSVHRDEFGNVHRLWRIDDPERLRRYREALADAAGLIADGHHRYKTARLYAAEVDARRGDAAAAKLAVVTSLASRSLTIDPIHRALPFLPDETAIADAVIDSRSWSGGSGSDLAEAVEAAPPPSLALLRGDATSILTLDPRKGPQDLPPAASELAVVMLHGALFPRWRLAPGAATDGTIAYRSDPDELWRAVRSGEFPAGIVLPPMSAGAFAAAIAQGDVLPPKSTRFLPKVVSGLVWAAHRDPIR